MKTGKTTTTVLFILFVILAVIVGLNPAIIDGLTQRVNDNSIGSASVFVLLLIVATVFAPITILPVIPAASLIFGAFETSLLSILGWTLGAMAAFLLARFLGKAVLQSLVSLKAIERLEDKIGRRTEFWYFVFLRMIVPVDILSYTFGFLSGIPFGSFSLATLLGVAPFSFIFAYGGEILLRNIFNV